jgi:hypothetical protein
MVFQRHRDVLLKTSRCFTEDIAMIWQRHRNELFFAFAKPVFFPAESRLKDAPFSHSRLYTISYKPAES